VIHAPVDNPVEHPRDNPRDNPCGWGWGLNPGAAVRRLSTAPGGVGGHRESLVVHKGYDRFPDVHRVF
jgi:hypothetical protein